MIELNTFSIAARCAKTGMLGVAVATALPAVGGLCLFGKAKVGAVVTQSWINPYLGLDAVTLLEEGLAPEAILDRLVAGDPGHSLRQVGIVDALGRSAAFTGADCVGWAGHEIGNGFTVQGNMLLGPKTIQDMADAAALVDLPLHERLMRTLEAGQRAGGDKRGKQSAALKVFNKEDYAWLDLRVDDHAEPVAELRRVLEVVKHQLIPVMDGMPSRENPVGSISAAVVTMLMTPPALRPNGAETIPQEQAPPKRARVKRVS